MSYQWKHHVWVCIVLVCATVTWLKKSETRDTVILLPNNPSLVEVLEGLCLSVVFQVKRRYNEPLWPKSLCYYPLFVSTVR